MAASWVKLASAVGIASALCSMIPSCADNNETIFIRQVQALRAPECTVTADATAFVASTGFVDVGLATNYVVFPLVGSQLLARGDARQSKAESNRVLIQGAEVELVEPTGDALSLSGLDGGALPNPYTVLATGTIDPSASAEASYGVTEVEVMPPVFLEAYRRQILAPRGIGTSRTVHARIRVFGKTLGNTDVETGIFTYPINVCYGCGVFVPAEAVEPTITTRNCKGGATTATTASRTTCRVGQDSTTDCRFCQGAIPLCTPCSTNDDCAGMRSTLDPTKAATCATVGFCE
jgi:hypothetical protein